MKILRRIICENPDDPLSQVGQEPSEEESASFLRIVSTEITAEQEARVIRPAAIYPEQRLVTALHWHPEFIPLDMVRQRLDATFPSREDELIVPTQHNEFMSYDSVLSGIELDCFSGGFN